MSGIMSITGEGPGRPPVKVGPPITDITAGLLAAMGVAAAYAHKLKTGQGQRVDTSLFEAGITQTYWQSAIAFATGVSPGPLGSAHPLSAPYQAFETSDGWITLGASNQKTWSAVPRPCSTRPRSPAIARFTDNAGRMANLPDAGRRCSRPISSDAHRRSGSALLEKAGVPAGPVLSVQEMHAHPQTKARDMVPVVEHCRGRQGADARLAGEVLGDARARSARGAPTLGQHSRDVLAEAGYSPREIDDLIKDGVVAEPSPASVGMRQQ